MKLSYERVLQGVADRLEAAPGTYGLEKLYLSQVLQAVESLGDDGHALEYIVGHEELIAERIRDQFTAITIQ